MRRRPGRWRHSLLLLLLLGVAWCASSSDGADHARLLTSPEEYARTQPSLNSSTERDRRSLVAAAAVECAARSSAARNLTVSQFPSDLFSREQRQKGAVLLHLAGLVYMFVALAIVCDEFFVPALGVLTEKLEISDDVAGATFMAAGGSAPEFFTSLFGVFVAQNNVGIGTIVGSATFNILCVLAFCTLFSRQVLQLTWWPLFRDMFFYIFALFLLVIFFADEKIAWHEALTMFLVYVMYAIFMKYNSQIEQAVKSRLFSLPEIAEETASLPPPPPQKHPQVRSNTNSRRSSGGGGGFDSERRRSIQIHGGNQQVRGGIVSIAMHSVDDEETPSSPTGNAGIRFVQVKPKSTGSSPVASSRGGPVVSNATTAVQNGGHGMVTPVENTKVNGLSVAAPEHLTRPASAAGHTTRTGQSNGHGNGGEQAKLARTLSIVSGSSNDEKPLDMSWPETNQRRVIFLLLAPILYPLYITLPDTRRPEKRRYFPVTFIGSILWIAFFSYLMVWWANTIGDTFGVPTEVMGLTVLAAGTSIPDLITSVIVARKGLGDMAVSSSIGSNLFDICIGLPVPWLMYFTGRAIAMPLKTLPTVSVVSNGLICSVGLLFLMLLVLVSVIAASKWRMDKFFGLVMMVSYALFCVFSILLETRHVSCPLKIVSDDFC